MMHAGCRASSAFFPFDELASLVRSVSLFLQQRIVITVHIVLSYDDAVLYPTIS
jgi:hypothetical protein